jgi:cytochrome c
MRMKKSLSSILLPIAALVVTQAIGSQTPTAAEGRVLFEKRCTVCHTLDHEKVGPRLAGVIGRKAGSVPSFQYSDAVKKSALIWNAALLDKWLVDTEAVIPDNDMSFRLNNAQERAAIIAFLKETTK